jgi:hypothetical protein
MNFRLWALAVVVGIAFLFVPASSQASSPVSSAPSKTAQTKCTGDCQTGAIGGPYTSAQVAEYTTTAPFTICESSTCTSGSWSADQIEGIDAQQNIGTSYQFFDYEAGPDFDANIAVGPTVSGENAQVLEWVNPGFIQAFDKVTGQPIFTTKGGTTAEPVNVAVLWSTATQPECANNPSSNVQIVYDRLDGGFVISRHAIYTSGGIHEYAWCIAVSSGSDLSSPSNQWYSYEYRMSTAIPCVPNSDNCTTGAYYYYFPDWPRVGTWSNGYYISFDLTDPTVGYEESGTEICQLDRVDISQGNPSNPMVCYTYLVTPAYRPSLIHSVDVADIDSATGPTTGEPAYFLSIVNPSNEQQGDKGYYACTSKTTPCTSNQLALFTWGASGLVGPTFIAVNPYTPGCYNTSKVSEVTNTYCVPEPSTNPNDINAYGSTNCGNFPATPCVDSLGDRMANRLTYNNLSSSSGGPNGEYLTASHVVEESTSNQRTGIRYYILGVSNGKASVVVNSGGSSGPPDLQDPNDVLFYFMPSAALDQNGNLGITFNSSGAYCSSCSTQNHPAVNFDVLPWGASSFDASTLIIQGTADEQNTDRWGEYAATVIDSTDDLTFYGIGEYYDTAESGTTSCWVPASDCYTWQTRILRGQYGNPF